jgi:transcriptional regulator with XRE-family HTH domain
MRFRGTRNIVTRDFAWNNCFQVTTLRKQFGEQLRRIRLSRRMSQERFAETLDISVEFLSLIERGKNAPSFETLDKMAKRLNIPVAYLFTFGSAGRRVMGSDRRSAGRLR